jgi:hypothetical protein
MRSRYHRAASLLSHPVVFAAFLLALCLAAYAPLITRLGFYWDDFPINWIASTMGGAGLARYFSTNRPVWGLIYQVTTPLLGSTPLPWQVFALLLRWLTGLALWALLRLTWGGDKGIGSTRGAFAAWAAAVFVLYPGFSQQFIAFLYSHFYIVLLAFLLSLICNMMALRLPENRRGWYIPLLVISLLLSLLNLLSMEYFFLLEFLRPLLIWIVLSDRIPNRGTRLRQTLLTWLPFLAVFGGAMYWRAVLFGFQTYQPALMSRLKASPLRAVINLLPLVFSDVWKTSAGAWAKAFSLPNALELGARNVQRYGLFVAAGAAVSMVYLLFYRPSSDEAPPPKGRHGYLQRWRAWQAWAWQPVAVGILALLIAGSPFWLTDLQIGLVFPNDRFTVPFIFGAALVTAGLLALLPVPRQVSAVLLALGLGFAIGLQYQNAVVYNRDWSVQRSMFWQMLWRMPGLQPGTALLANELPVVHYTDNSLTAPLNWMYDAQNDPQVMQYALLYPTLRKTTMLKNFQKNQPVELDYLAASFHGSTSQVISFYYNPPGCLRVLDPEIDLYNWMIPTYLRESLPLADMALILPEPQAGKPAPRLPAHIYGAEIPRGWCYYFEKADLARQVRDWQTVAQLGDQAFNSGDYPNDPLERFPFIEGYAHTGRWDRAETLSQDSYVISPIVMQPMTCKLWERIARDAPASAQKDEAVKRIQSEMKCTPFGK